MKNRNWTVRPATTEEYKIFSDDLGFTVRAWVLDIDGVIAGIGGVVMKSKAWTVFLKVVEGVVVSKRVLYLAMIDGFRNILQMNLPVLYAIKDKELESAERLLPKFGFGIIACTNGEEIFRWDQK